MKYQIDTQMSEGLVQKGPAAYKSTRVMLSLNVIEWPITVDLCSNA